MELGLNGRIAFVSGASKGIGKNIAETLAAEGVHLGLFSRDQAKCEDFKRELQKTHQGLNVIFSQVDFEKPETISPAVKRAAEALGGCDILINCAGGSPRGRLHDIPDQEWDRYFSVKPLGYIRMVRECLPYLTKSDQGRVINIAGHRGKEPGKISVAGSPVNQATVSHTKWLASDLGPSGITANVVSPGDTDTGRWGDMIRREAEKQEISLEEAETYLLRRTPLGRVVKPRDISHAVVFLASQAAEMITGSCITVDGGYSRSI